MYVHKAVADGVDNRAHQSKSLRRKAMGILLYTPVMGRLDDTNDCNYGSCVVRLNPALDRAEELHTKYMHQLLLV